jgi:hypothetical protein
MNYLVTLIRDWSEITRVRSKQGLLLDPKGNENELPVFPSSLGKIVEVVRVQYEEYYTILCEEKKLPS